MNDRTVSPDQRVRRWNRVFTALSTEPRRQLVDALIHAPPDESVPLPGAAVNPMLSVDHERLHQQLVHHHLPLLADSKYVRWERTPLRAYRGPQFEEVEIVLQSLYANGSDIPDQLVNGCRTLEANREGDPTEP